MASATMPRVGNEIKFEYGVAQKFALKYTTGKNCGEAKFPPFGPRVMFTAIDERKLWLGAEEASELEHALLDLGIQPADFIRVTKIKHPRGGGSSLRVERVGDADSDPDTRHPARMPAQTAQQGATNDVAIATRFVAPSRMEALLEKSVELARDRGPAAFITPKPDQPAAPAVFTTDAAPMLAAMCAAVDAIVETQAYAQRRGLGVTFSEESVRAIGLSIYIGNQRGTR